MPWVLGLWYGASVEREEKRRGEWGGSGCCGMMSVCLLRVEFGCGWRGLDGCLDSRLWRSVSLRVGTALDLSFIWYFTYAACLVALLNDNQGIYSFTGKKFEHASGASYRAVETRQASRVVRLHDVGPSGRPSRPRPRCDLSTWR